MLLLPYVLMALYLLKPKNKYFLYHWIIRIQWTWLYATFFLVPIIQFSDYSAAPHPEKGVNLCEFQMEESFREERKIKSNLQRESVESQP
jgi:hypothetical protein